MNYLPGFFSGARKVADPAASPTPYTARKDPIFTDRPIFRRAGGSGKGKNPQLQMPQLAPRRRLFPIVDSIVRGSSDYWLACEMDLSFEHVDDNPWCSADALHERSDSLGGLSNTSHATSSRHFD